jgi:hypothetical protein
MRVEALSVTPFSATALERGLDGVLASAARVPMPADVTATITQQDGGGSPGMPDQR